MNLATSGVIPSGSGLAVLCATLATCFPAAFIAPDVKLLTQERGNRISLLRKKEKKACPHGRFFWGGFVVSQMLSSFGTILLT